MALVHLISYLEKAGVEWIDLQVLNPFTESLGAVEIPRDEFMKLMTKALKQPRKLFSTP